MGSGIIVALIKNHPTLGWLFRQGKKGGETEMKIKRMVEIKAVLFNDEQVCINCAIEAGLTKGDIKEWPADSVITDREMEADELDYIICDRCKKSIT